MGGRETGEDSDELPETETEDESADWLSAIDLFKTYKINLPQIRELVRTKSLRTKRIAGQQVYSVSDVKRFLDKDSDATPDMGAAELVRAATGMLRQFAEQDREKHKMYNDGFEKLMARFESTLEKREEYIAQLETDAMKMREAAEKIASLEHERKLSEQREERTRQNQQKALETLGKTLGPWLQSKLAQMGGGMPKIATETPEGAAPDPRLAELGKHVVSMVVTMSDEKFAALETVIPAEEFAVLSMIRDAQKSDNEPKPEEPIL